MYPGQRIKSCFLGLVVLVLCACSHTNNTPVPDNGPVMKGLLVGAAGGAVVGSFASGVSIPLAAALGGIVGGAMGKALQAQQGLLSELDKGRVQIIRNGEEYLLVLPSDHYFFPNSTHVNPAYYPTLAAIADFLSHYETENIKVAGFTDNQGDHLRNLALSRQQAQNIASYLWSQGLDARSIYSIGYGEALPIAMNDNEQGRAHNRRVQISFRFIPSDTVA